MNSRTKPIRHPSERLGRQEKHAKTTSALLESAAATFAERGFEASSMDEIAERAGLSKGALYYRFRTKQDLFLALLDQRCDLYARQIDESFADGAQAVIHPREIAIRFARLLRRDHWPRLFLEFVSRANREAASRRELRVRMARLRKSVGNAIEGAMRRADVEAAVSSDVLARAMISLATGWAIERLADPRGMTDELYGDLVELMAAGVASRTAASAASAPRASTAVDA